jgi:transcriptional regulator with XRE-family HTH domain
LIYAPAPALPGDANGGISRDNCRVSGHPYRVAVPWDDEEFDSRQQRGFRLLGATIRRRRASIGLSQRQLEAISGIDQTVISRIENGKQTGLRWVRLAQLVDALDGLEIPRQATADPLPPAPRRPAPPLPVAKPKPRVIDAAGPDIGLSEESDTGWFDPNW